MLSKEEKQDMLSKSNGQNKQTQMTENKVNIVQPLTNREEKC